MVEDEMVRVILQGVKESLILSPLKPNFFFPPLQSLLFQFLLILNK